MATLNVREVGSYIREQRHSAQLSVRQLAKLADVSNPYLSQIERGMRKPSAEILQQIAKGLRISAEALYVQAGILDDRESDSEVPAALLADAHLTERQRQVLLEIYESFRRENAGAHGATAPAAEAARPAPAAKKKATAGKAGQRTAAGNAGQRAAAAKEGKAAKAATSAAQPVSDQAGA